MPKQPDVVAQHNVGNATATTSITQTKEVLPGVFLLPHKWRTQDLLGLPQNELRSWFDNMEAGRDISGNDITINYKIGDKVYPFGVIPKRLYLPDGSVKALRDNPEEEDKRFERAAQVIKSDLKSRIKDGKVHLIALKGTTNDLIDELVDSQIMIMRELGVERYGYFRKAFMGISHQTPHMAMTLDVNMSQIFMDDKGRKMPEIALKVGIIGHETGDVVYNYHTHPGRGNSYPSLGDIVIMRDEREQNVVIATRDNEKAYTITEWRLKTGVEIEKALKPHIGKRGKIFGWIKGKQMMEFVNSLFDRRNYQLRKGDDGQMSIEEIS